MRDAAAVGRRDPRRGLAEDLDALAARHGPAGHHPRAKVGASDPLHGEKRRPLVGVAEVEDGDDVRVAQAGEHLGLAQETPGLAARLLRVHDLEGHRAVERFLLGQIHLAHAATPEPRGDAILAPDGLADQLPVAHGASLAHNVEECGPCRHPARPLGTPATRRRRSA
jgi:hypothetical protein